MFLRLRIPPTIVGVIANLLNNHNCTAATVIMNSWQIEDPAKTVFMLGVHQTMFGHFVFLHLC